VAEQQRNSGTRDGGSALDELKTSLTSGPAVERLKEEAAGYAAAQVQRMVTGAGRKLGDTTNKLNDIAEGKSPGLARTAAEGGKKFAEGKGPVRSALEIGAGNVKDKAKEAFKSLGGKRKSGGGTAKFMNITEHVDVGVPVREAYNQWTQYQEFGTFAKGVQGVEAADDTTANWRAKIFWSSRSWKADITEQVPDERMAWTSEGSKGSTKGVVTFHALTDNLTRVLLVIEYYPKGLFEKTGNIWRAQGRRVRLDLKHYQRFVMMRGEATGEWRGEIRDGEVVRSHEEAVEDEDGEPAEEPATTEEIPDGEEPAAEDDEPERAPDEEPDEDDEETYEADETDEDREDGEDDDADELRDEEAEIEDEDEEVYEPEREPERVR
jgi:uncharacterized membrane protein